MGSRSYPPFSKHTFGISRDSTTQTPQTFRQQQSLHIFSWSLGSNYYAHFDQTTFDFNIHPTMWQRCSHTCHHQRVRQPCSFEKPHRFTLDMAQQIMPTPDPTPCSYTRKHSRPFQPWRLLHIHTARLAGTRTTDQQTTHYYQEDHRRFDFCSWHWIYSRPIHPTIPTTCIPETFPKEPFGSIDLIPGEEVYTYPMNPGPLDQRLESRWRCLVRSTATGMDRRRVIWIPYTQLSQWNLYTLRFDHFFEDQISRVEILEKNPSPWDDSNTFWRRPRAKNPTFILVREKKSALLACLWLSITSKTLVAIVG